MSDYQSLFATADRFIELANQLTREDPSGTVGAALRYAAARYNAFEASLGNPDLRAEKQRLLSAFSEDFRQMLDYNIEEHINRS